MKSRKLWPYLTALTLVFFLFFAFKTFTQNVTPYISFAEAKLSGRQVQVAGKLKPDSVDYSSGVLRFTLLDPDKSESLVVIYRGTRPANLEEAESIVVIGKYDNTSDIFFANKILTKCPSKYEGKGIHPDNVDLRSYDK